MANEKTNSTKGRAAERYDRAVDRARNATPGAPQSPADDLVAKPAGIEMVLTKVTREQLEADLNSGDFEAAPQLLKLNPPSPDGTMDMITALLEGESQTEITDPDTGEIETVRTWILLRGSQRYSILSTVQLDKKLPPFVGEVVRIVRGDDKRIGTKIYTDYLVYGPKRADGTPRFSFAPASRQLAAKSGANENTPTPEPILDGAAQ